MRRERARRFTLIELLVVIAIIGILSSLLLPALSRAKSTSYRVLCGGNLRQVSTVLFCYAGDYGDWIPNAVSYAFDYSGFSHGYWGGIIKDSYIGNDTGFWRIMHCPYAPGVGPAVTSNNSAYTYGMRYYLSGSFPDAYLRLSRGSSRKGLSLWTSASSYPLVGDSLKLESGTTPVQYAALDGGRLHIRHSLGAVLLFVDGHAAYMTGAEISSANYGPSFGVTITGKP